MSVEDQVRGELRDHAERVEVTLPGVEEVRGRARGQTLRVGLALATAAVALIAVGAWLVGPALPGVDVVDTPPGGDAGVTATDAVLLDGTRLRLALPSQLVADADDEYRWAGAVYAAPSLEDIDGQTPGWRLDVRQAELDEVLPDGQPLELPDGSAADGARLLLDATLGLQFGGWAAVVSGDQLTDEHVDLLLDGIDLTETPDGNIQYSGSLVLWQVDAPDLRLAGKDTAVSVFLRRCSKEGTTTTDSGLAIARVKDTNRTSHLTVLCSVDFPVEIWLDTSEPLEDEVLTNVAIDAVTSGSILAAIHAGRAPGSPDSNLEHASTDTLVAEWTGPEGERASRGPHSFEVQSYRGPTHCGWQSAVFLSVAWPLGSSMETADGDDVADTRQYIRDPAGVVEGAQLAGDLDLDANLPDQARRAGYQLPTAQLWFGPDDGDSYVYLALDNGTVERWPRAVQHVACL